MAEGLNEVNLLGNLGADPELRVTSGGQAILKLRLATTESYLDRENTRQERTEWHSVTLWGKRAEGLSKILNKGDRIFVKGGLRTSSYEKDGEKRYRTEINANQVLLCGGKRGGGESEAKESKKAAAPRRNTNPEPESVDDDFTSDVSDDDIPF